MTENISLCLKTTQINASSTFADYLGTTVSTSTGQVTNNRTSYTWYNVNLRTLLDPIYNKYNKFNISLNNVITSTQGSATSTANDRQIQVKMSGLMWLSSYNQSSQKNDQNKVIKLMQFQRTNNSCDSFHFTEQYHTFLKGSDVVNITINLHNVDTDSYTTTVTAGELFGHFIFNFNIQGVPEELNDRLEIKQKSTAHINNVASLR
jgi:hypothetical protein